MGVKEFCRGRWGAVVFATAADGTCPAAEFFEQLSASDQTKLITLFKRFADFGKIINREKFKKIGDNLFEFKSFQIRVFCFIERNELILTHGCIKKRDNLGKADTERAERIRSEHRKKSGSQIPSKQAKSDLARQKKK
jgi:hypothetical protein